MAQPVRKHQWTLLEFAAAIVVAAIGFRWLETLPLIVPFALIYVANKTPLNGTVWLNYTIFFTLAWYLVAECSIAAPGDEYAMAVIGLMPLGGWAGRLIGNLGTPFSTLNMVALAGLIPAAMYGLAMDRARVKLWWFVPLVAAGVFALTVWALSGYESYQRAMSKNGSLTAYVSASALLTLPLAAILSTLIAVGVNWWSGGREPAAQAASKD